MIWKIIYDIKWFVVVLSLWIFGSGNAFYIIGQNQVLLNSIPEDEIPSYSVSVGKAMVHVLNIGIANIHPEDYNAGEDHAS